MENQTNNSSGKVSEFNEASLKMLRISNLQILANNFQIEGNYKGWYEALCGMYKELVGKLKDEEKIECREIMQKISIKLRNYMQIETTESFGYVIKSPKIKVRNMESELFDFDCKLRELLDSHGYGSPEAEDSMF